MKIQGMEELQAQLEKLQVQGKKLQGDHQIGASELLTPEFMSLHTRFPTFDAMVESSIWPVASTEDFAAIPDEPWDTYVNETTDFDDWHEMLSAAGRDWVLGQLRL